MNHSLILVDHTEQGFLRWLLLLAGWAALLLGLLGIVLPLLPTAPFLLLAVAAFSRSSPAMAEWIYTLPVAGRYLRDWQEGGISPRTKWLALLTLWLTAAWTLAVVAKTVLFKAIVIAVTVLASLQFLVMPTRRDTRRVERPAR